MQVWYIRLFGSLRACRDNDELLRFSTRKTGTLLAFLAFYRAQWHSRELLCEMLWPDESPQKSRARLRVALTSLRHQLEPPGVPAGSVIHTEGHEQVQLVGESVQTDVGEVESSLKTVRSPTGLEERIAAARRITALFTQPLLSGFYEDWVITERTRLAQDAVNGLVTLIPQVPPEIGLELARQAVDIDPLAEEPLFHLLPLLAEAGQLSAAQRHFQQFRRRWEAAMGQSPSHELQDLVANLEEAVHHSERRPLLLWYRQSHYYLRHRYISPPI